MELHGHSQPPPDAEQASSRSHRCSRGERGDGGRHGLTEAEGTRGEGEGRGEGGGRGGRRTLLLHWTVLKTGKKYEVTRPATGQRGGLASNQNIQGVRKHEILT